MSSQHPCCQVAPVKLLHAGIGHSMNQLPPAPRDLSVHLRGRRLTGASDAIALRRDLVARAVADDERLAQALSAAAAAPRRE